MSWEEDFRRNIERTRQRIMEIAPDMLDLKAHHSAAVRPPPRAGAQPMSGEGTRPPTTSDLPFASRFHTTSDTARTPRASSHAQGKNPRPLRAGLLHRFCPTGENPTTPIPGICDIPDFNVPDRPPPPLPAPPPPWPNTAGNCGTTDCYDQWMKNAPISGAGAFSPKSGCQPVFSMTPWFDGKAQTKDCSPLRGIARLINMTVAGDKVKIAICAWYDVAWEVVIAVWKALNRGVEVMILAHPVRDFWAQTGKNVYDALQPRLGDRWQTWSYPSTYYNILHHKFVLIERVKAGQKISAISGMNWAEFDITRNCDLLIMSSATIFDAFEFAFFSLMYSAKYKEDNPDQPTPLFPMPPDTYDETLGVSAHFWPSHPAKPHPAVDILSKFKPGPTTLIRVIAASWTGGATLDSLVEHRKNGSDVRILANHHKDPCWSGGTCKLHPAGGAKGGKCETIDAVWDSLHNNGIHWGKVGTHSKILIVSGPLKTGGNRSSVFTGSTNFSEPDSQPDAWVGVHDDALIFSQYINWWKWLCTSTAMSTSGLGACTGPQEKT